MPGQFIVNCAVKSMSPTVNVFESVLLARFETNAYSFHEIKNAKIPADAIPDRDSGNSICQNACSLVQPSVIATSDIALGICLKKPSVNQIVNGIFKATKTSIIPICVSIKPIFEKIIKIGKLKDMPGIVLVNMINKKYLFLCLKLCLAKPYPPIVPTNTAINVLVKEIISEFRK